MIVEKKTFELPQYMTRSGGQLKRVRVGWESYGTLDRERSNAILVTHYFSAAIGTPSSGRARRSTPTGSSSCPPTPS
jgi:homoserine acetyltransferase